MFLKYAVPVEHIINKFVFCFLNFNFLNVHLMYSINFSGFANAVKPNSL